MELLLEGLQGAETCDTYRFHFERGYGTQYYTQVRRSGDVIVMLSVMCSARFLSFLCVATVLYHYMPTNTVLHHYTLLCSLPLLHSTVLPPTTTTLYLTSLSTTTL